LKQALLLLGACCFVFLVQAQEVRLSSVSDFTIKNSEGTSDQSSRKTEAFFAAKRKKGGIKFLFGIKAGASTANIVADEVSFENGSRQFTLTVDNNEFSYHLGVFGQVRLNNWAIQPEVLFRSARADYKLSEFITGEFVTSIRTENYAYVDVPLMFAYRVGALRVQAGPVAKFYIDSSTELLGFTDLTQSYQQVDLGYQAGIGLDFWRLVIDLKYDRDLDDIGDHMSFAGEQLRFNSKAGRFVFSLGYSFVSP